MNAQPILTAANLTIGDRFIFKGKFNTITGTVTEVMPYLNNRLIDVLYIREDGTEGRIAMATRKIIKKF